MNIGFRNLYRLNDPEKVADSSDEEAGESNSLTLLSKLSNFTQYDEYFYATTLKKILSRLREKRRFIQILFGPRLVGKTTLIHQPWRN